jgi:hypothetical protein
MATATTVKAAKAKLDLRLLGRAASSGGTFDVTVKDPSNFLVFVDATTSASGNVQLHVTAGTTGTAEYTGEGIGDWVDRTTGGAGGGEHYVFGPFESFRFVDTSTGGRLINIRCSSTTGGASSTGGLETGVKLSFVEIVPST